MLIIHKNKTCSVIPNPGLQHSLKVPLPIPPAPHNTSNLSYREWHNRYNVYIDKIIESVITKLCLFYVDGYEIEWNTRALSSYLMQLLYNTSTNVKKSYYFFK